MQVHNSPTTTYETHAVEKRAANAAMWAAEYERRRIWDSARRRGENPTMSDLQPVDARAKAAKQRFDELRGPSASPVDCCHRM